MTILSIREVTPMKQSLAASVLVLSLGGSASAADRVITKAGPIEGTIETGGIRAFKGIPYAAPPVGDLRWQPPQPVKAWTEVRPATAFGAECMQRRQYADMVFRSNGRSEDCLFLNVWTPATAADARLPVLVYFYGGGFTAGDGSEPRYDGAAMARRGIVALTVNYRLGVFGLLAHPELTKESPRHASGNYGLLDQSAALQWVRDNIAAFGGDPQKVTIAGESAGSISVSAQMASPLSKGLIAGAIGESGAAINPTFSPVPLQDAERAGTAFATTVNAASLAALRAIPAADLLEAAAKPGVPRFQFAVDGYFLPKTIAEIFLAGEQAHVPLLAGWNSQESGARGVLGTNEATPEGYAKAVRALFGDRADEALKLYPGTTNEEVAQSATDLASDRFIAFSTWKWTDAHGRTGGKPVYRYYYSRPRPAMKPEKGTAGPASGAAHSAEIEYAMGNLAGNDVYAWTPDDYKVSETFQGYLVNFVKTGDPNGAGLPAWPAANKGNDIPVLQIDVVTSAKPDTRRARYLFLDQVYAPKPGGSR
jgi:para-nitrobenzyl esterase